MIDGQFTTPMTTLAVVVAVDNNIDTDDTRLSHRHTENPVFYRVYRFDLPLGKSQFNSNSPKNKY